MEEERIETCEYRSHRVHPSPRALPWREPAPRADIRPWARMSPDGESTRPGITESLKRNYDDRLTPVVPVMSPVVASVGRCDRGYRKQSGKQKDHNLFHFCSSNFSLMDLSRDLQLGFPAQ